MMFQSIEDASKSVAWMLWNILMTSLPENWVWVFLGILTVFVLVLLKAMLGRWGSLGSFLYHFLYFGTLFIIGLIWGLDIFTEGVVNVFCAVILYSVCYILVGIILDKTGLKKRRF